MEEGWEEVKVEESQLVGWVRRKVTSARSDRKAGAK